MEPPKAPRLWGLCPAAMDGFNFQHRPLPLSIEVVGPRACLGLTSATIQQGQQGVTWQKAGSVQPSLRPGGAPPQVYEGLSLGSHQLYHMQVRSRLERAKAVKWMCQTLAPETTVPAQTSTAWYWRTTCSPAPWSSRVARGTGGAGLGVFNPAQQDLSTCSPGTLGKESGPSPSCLPRARNKELLNPTRVSASPLGQEVGVQCPGWKAPHFHPGSSRALVVVQLLSRV